MFQVKRAAAVALYTLNRPTPKVSQHDLVLCYFLKVIFNKTFNIQFLPCQSKSATLLKCTFLSSFEYVYIG